MFIEKIFKTLSKPEKREFLLFLDRKKRKENRKDIEISKALMSDMVPKVENSNNYHAVRNRIKKELILFIFLKQIENDSTGESELLNEINLCRFLFNNQLEKQAWGYLFKVEKKALKFQNYKGLYATYMLMLEYAYSDEYIPIEETIEKKNKIKNYLDNEEKLIDTLAIVRNKLYQFKVEAKTQSLTSLIDDFKNKIDLNHPSFYQYPKQVCNYLELVRGSLLYNRDVRQLEPIALDLYNKTLEQGSFTKHNLAYKIKILYLLCHALYRNYKFKECLVYLNEIESNLDQAKQNHLAHYYAKIASLKSSISFLSNNIDEAIVTLETFFETKHKINTKDDLNLKLSLLTYYAYNKEYRKANRFFIQMHHSNGWYKKLMGQEWVFKKNAIEMLLQFEMGKDDIALNRINAIIKNNRELTNLNQYKDVIYFLKLFKKYIEDPTSITANDLLNVSDGKTVKSADNEIKKTAFYSWFMAKVQNKDPYEVLMTFLKEPNI